jgi:diaminohydroxyphosphoribosylaminopyrimidine deaminase/5-amino-6-(5-phosphoribosylamino)uracil reductase
MQRALAEAAQALGHTHPNPLVGCVVAHGLRIVAVGHHRRAGGPHAEVVALRRAGARARGADVYVTLEPCSHVGRTGPCAEALIAARVRRVFVGSRDPNPQVLGRGIRRLRAAGIEVQVGLLAAQCRRLNAAGPK